LSKKFVIFTDLDGSLLNHEDYSFDEANSLLEKIKAKNIPLIYTTSKTKSECEILQKKMGLTSPFIVENGAAIYYPNAKVELLGVPHKKIKPFIDRHYEEFNILSFSNMRVEDIMEYTLFDYEQAKIAQSRDYSEPFLIRDERRLTELEVLAELEGMKILKGGRFYHLVGIDQDKGKAVELALKNYPDHVSIGLGDNYNDIAMLEVVDIPVLIPHHEGRYIELELKNLIKAKHKGALGWSEAVSEIIL
jgi:mannosyl-3-phosphoglycerate phosphatase